MRSAAAEQGLTDGEQDILNKDPVTRSKVRSDDYIKNDFSSDCIHASDRKLDGLCLPSVTTIPQWLLIDWKTIATSDTTPLHPIAPTARRPRLVAAKLRQMCH